MNLPKHIAFSAVAAFLVFQPCARADVEVSGVVARQRFPWNGLVDVECTVSGIEGVTNGLKLAVAAVDQATGRARNGSHFQVEKNGAWSDDREVATNGTYRLLWDARADLGLVRYTNMTVRVTCSGAHEKVQLWEGGPYWATTNIGADAPEDCGYYFWWGDTVGYRREGDAWVASDGSSQNFSFGDSFTPPTFGKNIATLESEGWIANGVLAPECDAAQIHWGGAWRIPTYQELYDLCYNKCDWTWTMCNGVEGYEVRGRGNYRFESIFLPAAGVGNGTLLNDAGAAGFYWSSVPYSGYDSARDLYFYPASYFPSNSNRYDGRSIRPVQGFAE